MNAILLIVVQFLYYLPLNDGVSALLHGSYDEDETKTIGKIAPEFSLEDLQGSTLDLSDLRGNYVVIHIATTWCPFCNAEAPYLEELSQQYTDKNVKVLIIDVKEPRDLVQSKLQDRFNFSFPVLLDLDGSVAARYAPSDVLPDLARDEVMLASNLLIDPEGKIQFLSLLDSKNFDAKLINLKKRLDELLGKE
jgi:peroxiredoxin